MEGEIGLPLPIYNHLQINSFSSSQHEMGFVHFEDDDHNQVFSFLASAPSHQQSSHLPQTLSAAVKTTTATATSRPTTANNVSLGFNHNYNRPSWNNNDLQVGALDHSSKAINDENCTGNSWYIPLHFD
ncbi:hypothetical protein ACJIZ3_007785 [Penstemon smallii]|uniref:Uncharacterized protein n=1 Tax=Penstemon smallii TaxID=265156 RepID=A0ABD3T7Y4_9LAMI